MAGVILILALTATAALLAAIAQYIFKLHMKRFSFSIGGILDMLLTRQIILGLFIYATSPANIARTILIGWCSRSPALNRSCPRPPRKVLSIRTSAR